LSKSNPYAAKTKTEAPVPEPVVETSYEVPTGSIAKVMDWVDGDSDKARAAYDAETEDKQRSSLLSQLKDLF
jgi:aminoglycoside phosphotransferase (APT) family kinase protein